MPTVLIAGAGLVGALNACYFAQKGWNVEVYEFRNDIRKMEHVQGRSINLALSERGKKALEVVGLKEYIANQGVAMHARLIHNIDGKTYNRQPYGKPGEHIVSINRRHLNEVMISLAEKNPNVKFFFKHKVKGVDVQNNEITVEKMGTTSRIPKPSGVVEKEEPAERKVSGDLILACDGAYSAIRKSLVSTSRFNYSQEYIEHGYIELNILPKGGEFAFEPNVFHLWPRGEFTLIALANTDKTFTVTIFAPFAEFSEHMATPDQAVEFFRQQFPDAFEALGRDHIHDTFSRVAPQSLVSIKCSPHHFGEKILLMGDAAHAMVPFYGQGMNCGFEDCLIFSEILDQFPGNIAKAVVEYSNNRVKNAHTINDLAMYNYEELKDLVNHTTYKLRKKLDSWLSWLFPNAWIPLYSMVTFTRIPYSQVVKDRKWQDEVIKRTFTTTTAIAFTSIAFVMAKKRFIK